jgi:hypothetical protein
MAYTTLSFDDVDEVGSYGQSRGSYLVRVNQPNGPPNSSAIIFSAILNEDNDGAPTCYARFNPASPDGLNGGLDFLRHAISLPRLGMFTPLAKGQQHHAWQWVGLLRRTEADATNQKIRPLLDVRPELAALNDDGNLASDPMYPVLRDDNDKFYVSTTGLAKNASAAITNPGHYWDASTVAYAAKTPPVVKLGVDYGDFGVAIRKDTGTARAFMYADAGNGDKVGEMSRTLFKKLFPRSDQEHHPVAFIVFPGSRLNPIQNKPDGEIWSRLQDLSKAANMNTVIGLMASGMPYGRPDIWYRMDPIDPRRPPQNLSQVLHQVPNVDLNADAGLNVGDTFQRIVDALKPFGFDPAVAAAAAQEAARADWPEIKPMDLSGLQIPNPPGR